MSGKRTTATISITNPKTAGEQVAKAMGGRLNAHAFLQAAVMHLADHDEVSNASLFDMPIWVMVPR